MPGRMAERGNRLQDLLEQLLLAALGTASVTAERMDELAEELADRGGLRRDEARQLVDELTARWRGERGRLSERAATNLRSLFRDLRLVTREDLEDLELRVAQVEHRLRLVEGTPLEVRHPGH